MIRAPSEMYPEAGLLVWRGFFSESLMADFASESAGMLWSVGAGPASRFDRHDQWSWTARELLDTESPATSRVLRRLGGISAQHDVAINYQPPFSAQRFHTDSSTYPAMVVQADDEGTYDYSLRATTPQEAERDFISLYVGAGDVILLARQYLFHRGSNIGPFPRITAVLDRLPDDVRL